MGVPLRSKASYNLGTDSRFPWISVGHSYTSSAAQARPAGPPLFRGREASQTQSLGDRAYGNAGDFYEIAGHFYRQRGPTPYGRDAWRQPGRSHLGAYQLPGFECHRIAHLRLALHPFRTQALLHDLRGAVYRLLAALRPCPYPAILDPGPYSARPGRRRAGSQRTSHPGGYLSGGTKRTGIRPLWQGGRGCARHWADVWWMDHRQLQLALDLLYQLAHRHHLPLAQQPDGGRSALPGRAQG